MNIPPPPTGPSFQRIQKDLLIAAEYVANMSMMESKIGLESILGINPLTNCVHTVVSYDGAYQIRSKKGGGGYSPYFTGMVSDGDNKTGAAIKEAKIYNTLGFD